MTLKWSLGSRAGTTMALALLGILVVGWLWSPVRADKINIPTTLNASKGPSLAAEGAQAKAELADTSPADHTDEQTPTTPTPSAHPLSQLAWMLGSWNDGNSVDRVENNARWSDGGQFLVRDYRQFHNGQLALSGTQIIGWDAAEQALHSWSFDSDGSVSQAYWYPVKDGGWSCHQVIQLADGRRGSFTQIIKPINGQVEIETIDVELDGLLRPGFGPHKLTREASADGFLAP